VAGSGTTNPGLVGGTQMLYLSATSDVLPMAYTSILGAVECSVTRKVCAASWSLPSPIGKLAFAQYTSVLPPSPRWSESDERVYCTLLIVSGGTFGGGLPCSSSKSILRKWTSPTGGPLHVMSTACAGGSGSPL